MNPIEAYVRQQLSRNPNLQKNPVIANAIKKAEAGDTNGTKEIADNFGNQCGANPMQIMKQIIGSIRQM